MNEKVKSDLQEMSDAIDNHHEVNEKYKLLFEKLTDLHDSSVMSSNSDSVDSCRVKFHEALDMWLCSRTNLGLAMLKGKQSYIDCINKLVED